MSANSLTRPYKPKYKPKHQKFKSSYIQQDISNITHYDVEENKDYEPPKQPYPKPAYPYRKLEGTDIRLLRIVPGTGAIECLLHQIPLEERTPLGEWAPSYFNALSYVWGDMTDKMTILLEGEPFQVTRNLFRALYEIREMPDDLGFPDDYFWIDAICINQEDVEERSQQIQRMTDIYRIGFTVVWLGPIHRIPTKSSPKKSLRNARSPKSQISYDEAIGILFEKARSMWMEWEPVDDNDNLIINETFGRAYRAVMIVMDDILRRPWFERIWTIQEACLYKKPIVYVGHHSVFLDDLIEFFSYFAKKNRILSITPGSMRIAAIQGINQLYINARRDQVDNPRRLRTVEVFSQILMAVDVKKSTDPRDQVYGLLGILKDIIGEELPDELLPNYHLSCAETYWAYAAFLFQSAGDLKLLDCSCNELQGVPSWVTDFRYVCRGPSAFVPSVYVSPDKRILHLQGCILGTFRSVLNGLNQNTIAPRREKIPVELTNCIKAFEEHILEPSASMRGITIKEALNNMIENVSRYIHLESAELFYEVYSTLRDSRRSRRSRTAKKKWTKKISMIEVSFVVHFIRPCLLLHDGTILHAQRTDIEVRTGDLICLFKGSDRPSILRASGENFTFLGQCRVGGGPLEEKILDDDFWASAHIEEIKLI
ncbi:HET-domain-containing protein [Daldinia loculata]|uniref:HET-domain-containing protein n=1 Tax=Daldinia loculata TaxID=103429 RepID=UPI0020C47943|nr:HET-domain-containing protein [Daldinia loculata]KAI1650746.1 HET-domain-containing protein [Daldinia loculata]